MIDIITYVIWALAAGYGIVWVLGLLWWCEGGDRPWWLL